MQETPHHALLVRAGQIGGNAVNSGSAAMGAASVRSAQRSFADRAREFAAASASLGAIGNRVRARKLGASSRGSPGRRREAGSPRPVGGGGSGLPGGAAGEWKGAAASRPPGSGARSAAISPRASSPGELARG